VGESRFFLFSRLPSLRRTAKLPFCGITAHWIDSHVFFVGSEPTTGKASATMAKNGLDDADNCNYLH
jgi:hypothetical protein